jgi:hypothetical protein
MCRTLNWNLEVKHGYLKRIGKMSEALTIMLENLSSETQKEVLKFYGYETAAEGNLDIIPLFVLEKEE